MILNNAHTNLVVDGDGLMNAIAVNTMKDFSLKKNDGSSMIWNEQTTTVSMYSTIGNPSAEHKIAGLAANVLYKEQLLL